MNDFLHQMEYITTHQHRFIIFLDVSSLMKGVIVCCSNYDNTSRSLWIFHTAVFEIIKRYIFSLIFTNEILIFLSNNTFWINVSILCTLSILCMYTKACSKQYNIISHSSLYVLYVHIKRYVDFLYNLQISYFCYYFISKFLLLFYLIIFEIFRFIIPAY